MEVVRLATLQALDCKSAIETLETVLEDARSGGIRSVAVAFVRPDGEASGSWSDVSEGISLAGSVALLQMRLLQELDSN